MKEGSAIRGDSVLGRWVRVCHQAWLDAHQGGVDLSLVKGQRKGRKRRELVVGPSRKLLDLDTAFTGQLASGAFRQSLDTKVGCRKKKGIVRLKRVGGGGRGGIYSISSAACRGNLHGTRKSNELGA